ncbi:Rho-binding antiterminator [Leptospira sp. FAT2]|uniref:Rho-binding antiterminator n=1 Tax=Leptospira sanjuanensis TaxID=2879643 RepID=UPI001EE863FA|nr:Rho-binding antiterminator [Leptospira sanjuanensis]MCG6168955.1 Rho-binding antiterminator [Leptospira sanjuanensis]MCG6194355.1 Rho-binding antiterminator [Leptospira sanjuanensis]
MDAYVPVSCDFYDRLEEIVLSKRRVSLEVSEGGNAGTTATQKQRISDLVSVNREEFAVLENGEKIRLDKILKINP